jgi:hypothetical protein
MGMQTAVAPTKTSPLGVWLTAAGLGVLVFAVVLYATGLSRAVAVWASPVGLIAAVLGVATLRGRAVPRWALLVLGTVAAVLLAFGVALWIYSAAHPPMAA